MEQSVEEQRIGEQRRLQLLNDALHHYLETLQPTPEADDARRAVVADMRRLVAETLPPELHCSVETFGSYRAGLHLPGSDLDFALLGWVMGPDERQIELHEWNMLEQQYVLQDLADVLEEQQLVQGKVERVLNARVPVIKFTHAQSGFACDFSICRPECTFKADMQKLLGSLDKRYATLYRLVKAWAAAHGLNDAAANTFNSWSLGLLVAFFLQCGTSPAVLPPIWQLLESKAPDVREPRVLQLPDVTSALLKRVFNQAATAAGAFVSRRARAGADALNARSIGELLAGFFAFYTLPLTDWSQGRNGSWRASTWWGDWKQAWWPGQKAYIFGIEDPFSAVDNTARAVGTHNHLSSTKTAAYIAATFAASHEQLQQALGVTTTSNSSSSDAAAPILSAFAFLFGPHAVLQPQLLPEPLSLQLQQQLPAGMCLELQQQLQQLHNCMELLSCSSSLINRDNRSIHTDAAKVELIEQALALYRQLTQGLGCAGQHHVCLGDHLQHRRLIEQQQAAERERKRQEQLAELEQRRRSDLLAALQQQGQDGQLEQLQLPDALAAAMQGLHLPQEQQRRRRPAQHQQQRVAAASSDGSGSSRSSSAGVGRGSGRSNRSNASSSWSADTLAAPSMVLSGSQPRLAASALAGVGVVGVDGSSRSSTSRNSDRSDPQAPRRRNNGNRGGRSSSERHAGGAGVQLPAP